MKNLLFLIIVIPSVTWAQDFAPFQEILTRHLQDKSTKAKPFQTAFDYQEALSSAKTKIDIQKQKQILEKINLSEKIKTKEAATAFWINSYNFFMISEVLRLGSKNGKITARGVKDFGSLFNPYWVFKQKLHVIGSKHYSLDQIEKEILLGDDYKKKGWKDARIHFAVNCASVGCPPLRKEIYTDKNLDQALNDNTRGAFTNPRHLLIDGNKLYLTHLFKWYKKDFMEDAGSVSQFIAKYVGESEKKLILGKTLTIDFIEYDWSLNKPSNF